MSKKLIVIFIVIVALIGLNGFSVNIQRSNIKEKISKIKTQCENSEVINRLKSERKEELEYTKDSMVELENEIKVYRMRYPNWIPDYEYDDYSELVDEYESLSNEVAEFNNGEDQFQRDININRELEVKCIQENYDKVNKTKIISIIPPFTRHK